MWESWGFTVRVGRRGCSIKAAPSTGWFWEGGTRGLLGNAYRLFTSCEKEVRMSSERETAVPFYNQ